ncbi:hypothetical protein DP107_18360 [Haloglomus irregulare]|uniref:DUF7389 domain-containing protein n=1 Tax=Haloglomus irregulare TaxID=2234134 RepID=A0A554MUD4_9EURY|nr:hypothetical protein DP107_18360 [Haloglomus irregulare]
MSEHTQPSRADGESAETSEQATRTEYVERSDVGVSLTVKLKRETILHFLLLERGIKIYG